MLWDLGLGIATGLFLAVVGIHPNILVAFVPLLHGFNLPILFVSVLVTFIMTRIRISDIKQLDSALAGLLVSIPLLLPLFLMNLRDIRNFTLIVLVSASSLLILRSRQKLLSSLMFMSCGLLGTYLLNTGLDGNLVVLSAFFGLFFTWQQDMPTGQPFRKRDSVTGSISSFVMNLFPAMSPNTTTAFFGDTGNKESSASAAMLSDVVFSLAILHLINNPRIGILVPIGGITLNELLMLLGLSLVISAVAYLVLRRMELEAMSVPCRIRALMFSLITVMFGYQYLGIFVISLAISHFVHMECLDRSLLMAFLILPTAIYFT